MVGLLLSDAVDIPNMGKMIHISANDWEIEECNRYQLAFHHRK